jgi:hypothetical protein
MERISVDNLSGWDQDTLETVQSGVVEVGLTETQLLLATGLPRNERRISGMIEFCYPRMRVLLDDGRVIGVTKVDRLTLDKRIAIEIAADDPEYSAVGGQWKSIEIGFEEFFIDTSGTGVGRYRLEVPADGKYRLYAIWLADAGNSALVTYRISRKGSELAALSANHRLHGRSWVELGEMNVEGGKTFVIEVMSQDGKPFSVGRIRIEIVNDSLTPTGIEQTTAGT